MKALLSLHIKGRMQQEEAQLCCSSVAALLQAQQAEAQLCCSSVAALLQAQQAEAQLCCSSVAALLQAQQAEAQALQHARLASTAWWRKKWSLVSS